MMETNFISINEAAKKAGVTRQTIGDWVRVHGLRMHTLATHKFIDSKELDEFLEASKTWRRPSMTITGRKR